MSTDPSLADLLAAAIAHHRAGRLSEAESAYRATLARDSHHRQALHLYGRLAYQQRNPEATVRLLSRALEQPATDDDDLMLRRLLAAALLDLGRTAAARATLAPIADVGTLTIADAPAGPAAIDNAIVVAENFSVIHGDRLMFRGLVPYSLGAIAHAPPFYAIDRAERQVLVAAPKSLDRLGGPAVLIGGDRNFSHMLLDWSSKFHALTRQPALRGLPLLVAPGLPASFGDLLTRLYPWTDRPDLIPLTAWTRVDHLHAPPLSHLHWQEPAPDHIAWLRQQLLPAGLRPSGERLYITRRGASHRRISNESDVADVLARHGFAEIAPERMTLDDQIARFAGASHLVTVAGAGAAALALMPASARILLLVNRFLSPLWLTRTAAAIGQHCAVLTCPEADNAGSNHFDFDIVVPPAELDAALSALV